MQSTDVGVTHESATNVNDHRQLIDPKISMSICAYCEHDIAEETQFLTPKSNVSSLFSVFFSLA